MIQTGNQKLYETKPSQLLAMQYEDPGVENNHNREIYEWVQADSGEHVSASFDEGRGALVITKISDGVLLPYWVLPGQWVLQYDTGEFHVMEQPDFETLYKEVV